MVAQIPCCSTYDEFVVIKSQEEPSDKDYSNSCFICERNTHFVIDDILEDILHFESDRQEQVNMKDTMAAAFTYT